MLSDVTNATIDAILHNEGRHPGRLARPLPLRSTATRANLKPDWCQFPPGAGEELPVQRPDQLSLRKRNT